jgi:type II secretory pathway pseudopilin PulG
MRSELAGAVLFEVVLALVLFAAAAVVVGTSLGRSVDTVDRLKRDAHAADLAVTVLAELQLGIRTTESQGPEPFEESFRDWTWELVLTPSENEAGENSGLTSVEVIVRHEESPTVRRLTQILKLPKPASPAGPSTSGFP